MYNPERLKRARLMAGKTREQAAAHVNVGASTIDRWERGETEPGASQLFMLAKFLDKDLEYFLRGNAKATG